MKFQQKFEILLKNLRKNLGFSQFFDSGFFRDFLKIPGIRDFFSLGISIPGIRDFYPRDFRKIPGIDAKFPGLGFFRDFLASGYPGDFLVGKDILNFNNFKAFDWRTTASPQFLSPQSPKINRQTF